MKVMIDALPTQFLIPTWKFISDRKIMLFKKYLKVNKTVRIQAVMV